jgi:di/tricarboxylate transporter
VQITLVLLLLVVAVVLLSLEYWSVDVVGILLMLSLVLTRIITPDQAMSSFGHGALVMIGSCLVMSGAIIQTGVANRLGVFISSISGDSQLRFFLLNLVAVTTVSAFINNVAATAIFVPIVMAVARRKKWSPSKFLLPVAYGSILGGTCTLIGTSTNVAVSGQLPLYNLPPFGLFEFLPIGLSIALIGIVYMTTIGRKLIPDRVGEDLVKDYHLKEYLTEITVSPSSALAGQTLRESDLQDRFDVNILGIMRQGRHLLFPHQEERFQVNDLVLLEGKLEHILHLKEQTGAEIRAEKDRRDFVSTEVKMIEVMVSPTSDLTGKTIVEVGFRQRFDLNVLAIYRQGESLVDKLGSIHLMVGDTLLVQGEAQNIAELRSTQDLIVLGEALVTNYRRRKATWAMVIFFGAIGLGGTGLLPISITFLMGAVLMVMTGCLSTQQAYENIEWRVLFLIAGMYSMGLAMESSGAAKFLAETIVNLLGSFGALTILAAFFWITVVLTQPLSNAAAALLVLPTAMSAAHQLGTNPRTFAMMVCIAASVSLVTPFEPSCILVYGPGKYQFLDFMKSGAVLTLLIFFICMLVIPTYWPL